MATRAHPTVGTPPWEQAVLSFHGHIWRMLEAADMPRALADIGAIVGTGASDYQKTVRPPKHQRKPGGRPPNAGVARRRASLDTVLSWVWHWNTWAAEQDHPALEALAVGSGGGAVPWVAVGPAEEISALVKADGRAATGWALGAWEEQREGRYLRRWQAPGGRSALAGWIDEVEGLWIWGAGGLEGGRGHSGHAETLEAAKTAADGILEAVLATLGGVE